MTLLRALIQTMPSERTRLRSIKPEDAICQSLQRENKIAVTLIPFSSCLEVELAFHLLLQCTRFTGDGREHKQVADHFLNYPSVWGVCRKYSATPRPESVATRLVGN